MYKNVSQKGWRLLDEDTKELNHVCLLICSSVLFFIVNSEMVCFKFFLHFMLVVAVEKWFMHGPAPNEEG